jgi:hypothetical protein
VKLNCVTQPDTVYSSESTKARLAVEINNQLRFTIFTENSFRLGEHSERYVKIHDGMQAEYQPLTGHIDQKARGLKMWNMNNHSKTQYYFLNRNALKQMQCIN